MWSFQALGDGFQLTSIYIRDLLTNDTLQEHTNWVIGATDTAVTISPGVSSANGLQLEWTNGNFVAIGNVNFSANLVSSVPEPGSLGCSRRCRSRGEIDRCADLARET
jgi:hypothetical protein